jgi:hypothetical protein
MPDISRQHKLAAFVLPGIEVFQEPWLSRIGRNKNSRPNPIDLGKKL